METTDQKAVSKERRKLRRAVVRAGMAWLAAKGDGAKETAELREACEKLNQHEETHGGA